MTTKSRSSIRPDWQSRIWRSRSQQWRARTSSTSPLSTSRAGATRSPQLPTPRTQVTVAESSRLLADCRREARARPSGKRARGVDLEADAPCGSERGYCRSPRIQITKRWATSSGLYGALVVPATPFKSRVRTRSVAPSGQAASASRGVALSIEIEASVSLLPNELSPATTALLGRNGRSVRQYTPVLAVCEMFESATWSLEAPTLRVPSASTLANATDLLRPRLVAARRGEGGTSEA